MSIERLLAVTWLLLLSGLMLFTLARCNHNDDETTILYEEGGIIKSEKRKTGEMLWDRF